MRWLRARRSPASETPPHPRELERRLVGQGAIDALLAASEPLRRPFTSELERIWLEALARPELSRVVGRLADVPLPKATLARLIAAYVKFYDVDTDIIAEPLASFATINAFFTRAIKATARPIDASPGTLVSPADANLKVFGEVDARGRIPEVKGRTYALSALLGRHVPAAPYIGGTYAVLYLSPRDYHRVHAPYEARVTALDAVEGASYPVNALGVRRIEGLFVRNKRLVFGLHTPDFGTLGLVMVGATNVGRITTSLSAGASVARGAELGVFNLGSTVVLVCPKDSGLRILPSLHEGEMVRMGQALMARA